MTESPDRTVNEKDRTLPGSAETPPLPTGAPGGSTVPPPLPPHPFPDPATPPTTPKSGRRRGCCLAAVAVFVLLCIVAAVGTYFSRRAFDRFDLPFPLPLPSQTPTTIPPAPTPHVLPDTVDGVKRTLEPVMRGRFEPVCLVKGIHWPPQRVRLVGLKAEKQLELWAANDGEPFHLLKTYPVLAASGDLGPKRRQGDKQVPEGHYRLVYLNPKSKFHLSLLLDYPNATDKAREAKALARGKDLGGDICVHGSSVSVGCLAIGDAAIEEVFTLIALAEPKARDILIFPADFRKRPDLISLAGDDKDVLALYRDLTKLAETVKN